jgi:hypothetical protein
MAGGRGEVSTVQLSLRSGATTRAEAPMVWTLLEQFGEKRRSTVLTRLLDCAPSAPLCSLPGDEYLTVFHQVSADPGRVTAVARGNQVCSGVVPSIAVNMIDDQVCSSSGALGSPIDELAAPVARMRSWAYVVVQNDAVRADAPCGTRQRVTGKVDRVVAVGQKFGAWCLFGLRLTLALVVARSRAEDFLVFDLGSPTIERGSAGRTRVGGHGSVWPASGSHKDKYTFGAPANAALSPTPAKIGV